MKLYAPEAYQEKSAAHYKSVASALAPILPAARIEHVGSSSVPGAISKADLDICVVVDPAQLEEAVQTLQRHGYAQKQDTLRTEALCMLECLVPGAEHAVQVVASGSQFEAFFIAFRDLLLASPELVSQYNHIKRKAEDLSADEYREAKSDFISSALAARKNAR